MAEKGCLFIVSGFAGAGKGTVTKQLVKEDPDIRLSISATTRDMRKGEAEGVDYFYISKESFEQKIKEGELLEYAKYGENYYGTPRSYVEQVLGEGKDVLLEIEVQGASKVKAAFPETIRIFVTPPSAKELKRRLVGRGRDSAEDIARRLSRAAEEAGEMGEYDYLLINDTIDQCVKDLHAIVAAERMKAKKQEDFISMIKEQLEETSKGE
ncbi:MAG: guanylate kinase [Lachnospiraceae bacterium]|nr:guanylate kinase [Lachnospiraceae bacterium]